MGTVSALRPRPKAESLPLFPEASLESSAISTPCGAPLCAAMPPTDSERPHAPTMPSRPANPMRVPRGNWPFRVPNPSGNAADTPVDSRPCASEPGTWLDSNALQRTHLRLVPTRAGEAACNAGSRPSERLHRPRGIVVRGAYGRWAISGRMADVCAELDRMLAAESAGLHLAPCDYHETTPSSRSSWQQ